MFGRFVYAGREDGPARRGVAGAGPGAGHRTSERPAKRYRSRFRFLLRGEAGTRCAFIVLNDDEGETVRIHRSRAG